MTKLSMTLAAAATASLLASSSASALSIVATATGPITAYFVGATAGYGSDIGLSINGGAPTVYGLQNHTAVFGNSLLLGNATIGDVLVFELRVATGNASAPPPVGDISYSLFSDPTLNILDGNFEHAMASAYAGGGGIPAGTQIGFEDILGGGDNDFDDHVFVFTNIGITPRSTPDSGSTLALGGLGLIGLSLIRRKMA